MLAGCGGGSAAQPDSALCAAGRDLAGALQQARGPGADPADPAAADATARLVPLLPDDLRRDVERYFQRQRERGPSAPDAHYRQLFTRISDHVLRQCGIDLPGE